jgi:tRNA uridine 5-carboxymethylaminomethyl modification enzyme
VIEGIGPRYCPSIEDKVVRFPDKERHQTFLEPEGLETVEVYPSGMSTSLPIDIQIPFYRSIEGLERVEIMRPAYAIEYDYVDPIQLHASLETKLIRNLFHAGQINGTSGYEEAAGQGLMAGINAALRVQGKEALVLGRSEAYIGVMIDDLITLGTKEPYRMFTSRAEYRLLLREDNADLRLRETGHAIGLVHEDLFNGFLRKRDLIAAEHLRISTTRLSMTDNEVTFLEERHLTDIQKGTSLEQLLRRPEITYSELAAFDDVSRETRTDVREQVEIQVKYHGYVERQLEQINRARSMEITRLPHDLDYNCISGLTTEVREKLSKFRPDTLGQASRISGVTPAAISVISIAIKANAWKSQSSRDR